MYISSTTAGVKKSQHWMCYFKDIYGIFPGCRDKAWPFPKQRILPSFHGFLFNSCHSSNSIEYVVTARWLQLLQVNLILRLSSLQLGLSRNYMWNYWTTGVIFALKLVPDVNALNYCGYCGDLPRVPRAPAPIHAIGAIFVAFSYAFAVGSKTWGWWARLASWYSGDWQPIEW